MGEIQAQIKLENFVDRSLVRNNKLSTNAVRLHQMDALVDTGAVFLMLPQDVVEKLGLELLRKVVVTYADERKEERYLAGAVSIEVCGRQMVTECIVGPPLGEALVGQIVMEALDLIADCQRRTLTPRPESPIYPSLKMK